MGRKCFQLEEIISKFREAEVFLAKGDTVGQVVSSPGCNRVDVFPLA